MAAMEKIVVRILLEVANVASVMSEVKGICECLQGVGVVEARLSQLRGRG